jgi:hypothetical protein
MAKSSMANLCMPANDVLYSSQLVDEFFEVRTMSYPPAYELEYELEQIMLILTWTMSTRAEGSRGSQFFLAFWSERR